MKIITFCF